MMMTTSVTITLLVLIATALSTPLSYDDTMIAETRIQHRRARGVEEGTQNPEDQAGFFFRPRFGGKYGKRSAGDHLSQAKLGFFMKPKKPRAVIQKRAVVEQATEQPEDHAAGFFFRPRFGKRAVAEDSTEGTDDAAAGFFFRPRFGKRAVAEESTESSEDGAAGFFFRPRFG